ncbi:MAG: hypothetical protein HY225_00370 [Candidatus Vogelbacteria bacterium]|nr:hypothetical protein [Candidatus Vogelbacteria bacterium]
MSKKTKYSLLILVMFVFALFVAFQNKHLVSASTSIKYLSGYAWSSNIGWISFSGVTTPPLYEVTYDTIDGILSGYAWSSNIGWISFGCGQFDGNTGRKLCSEDMNGADPVYPPATNGVTQSGPTVVLDASGNGRLVGFARACSVFKTGCSGALIGDAVDPDHSFDLGGWDGWISLSGNTSESPANHYGVNFNSQSSQLTGFAWGGGQVDSSANIIPAINLSPQSPGWISFYNDPNTSGSGGGSIAYGVKIQDKRSSISTVTCDKSPYPVINVPVTWTSTVVPADVGQYRYEWHAGNPGETDPTDYHVVGGLTNSILNITYNKVGPEITYVTVTDAVGNKVGECSTDIGSTGNFDVRDKDFAITNTGDLSATFITGGGIVTLTYSTDVDNPMDINISSEGGYSDPVKLAFVRISKFDSATNSYISYSGTNGALIVEPQFTNDTQTTAASTITLSSIGGVYQDASLRLRLTKNQDSVQPLPSGDYNVIIDSVDSAGNPGGHQHSITLHLNNPTGSVHEI